LKHGGAALETGGQPAPRTVRVTPKLIHTEPCMTALRNFTAPVLLTLCLLLCLLAGAGTASAAAATDTFSGEVLSDDADRALAVFDSRFRVDGHTVDTVSTGATRATRTTTARTAPSATPTMAGMANVPELTSLVLVLAAAACMCRGRDRSRTFAGSGGGNPMGTTRGSISSTQGSTP
jgi:hypothetical protein